MASRSCLYVAFLLHLVFQSTWVKGNNLPPPLCREVAGTSSQKMQFCLNLLMLEGEHYLRSSIGKGINDIAPGLIQGPAPIGARVANLDNVTRRIIEEFGYQVIGNIRSIINNRQINPIQRPQMNLSEQVFSNFIDASFDVPLSPPFNPYTNTINYVVSSYGFPTLLQQYLVGISARLVNDDLQRLAAGILGTVSGRVAVLRTLAYQRANMTVRPYQFTVANLSNLIAELVNRLGMCGMKDEGLIVESQIGAENRTTSNILSADVHSRTVSRTEREVMRILYGTGNATKPGGLFPNGLNGDISLSIRRGRLS